jgi:hypothetical protein
VLVLLVLFAPQIRRAAVFAAGVAAGFLVPVLPFAAIAPRQFYQSLIVAQIGSRAHAHRVNLWVRLKNITGVVNLPVGHGGVLLAGLAIVAFAVLAYVIAWYRTGQPPALLDWFAAVTAALAVVMFLWPPQFHYHFSAFLAPFLAMVIALPAARLLAATQAPPATQAADGGQRAVAGQRRFAFGLAGLALAAMAVSQFQADSVTPKVLGPVPAAVQRIVPAGACVLTDQASLTINANRFVSSVPGCPQLVDSLGTDLALSHGLKPGTGAARVAAVAAVWRSAFRHAQYVLLTRINARRIAWTPDIQAYFDANFVLVYTSPKHLMLYARKGLRT